jgi:hypothetical protein
MKWRRPVMTYPGSYEGTWMDPGYGMDPSAPPPLTYKRWSGPYKEALLPRRILSPIRALSRPERTTSRKHSLSCNPQVMSSSIELTKINKVDTHSHWT